MSKAKGVLGLVIGAIAGFVSGILVAPKSGKETRADIKEAGQKAKDNLAKEANKVSDTVVTETQKVKDLAEEKFQDAKDKVEDLGQRSWRAAEAAKDSFNKKDHDSNKK